MSTDLESETYLLLLKDLESNEAQTRSRLNQDQIDDLAAVLHEGGELETAVVFHDGATYFLASGFHRREAHRKEGRKQMLCVVKDGTLWDAIEYGIQDNKCWLGVRLTNAEKAAAVCKVLKNQPQRSDRDIAELCGVSNATVGKYRRTLESTAQIEQLSTRIGADSKIRALPSTVEKPRTDRCSCGADWTSDGNGGRFCENCNGVHPETPSVTEVVGTVSERNLNAIAGPHLAPSAYAQEKPTQNLLQVVQECMRRTIFLSRQISPLGRLSRSLYRQATHHVEEFHKLFSEAERALRQDNWSDAFLAPPVSRSKAA